METVSLLQDPRRTGGTATLVGWYEQWMARHRPNYLRLYLDEVGPSGLLALQRCWPPLGPIPRVLPGLQFPPYYFARHLLARHKIPAAHVHVVGASLMHGGLLPGPKAAVWFATLLKDERLSCIVRQKLTRKLAYRGTMQILLRLEEQTLIETSLINVISPYVGDRVVSSYSIDSSRVKLVPVPIDTARLGPPALSTKRRGVLFIGRAHDPRKGFDRLIDLAWSTGLVQQRGVTVVSPGPKPRSLPTGVTWLGPVADLLPLYQRHEVLVLPSRQEGQGIVAFEALACGTPVVAWNCGGVDSLLRGVPATQLVSTGEAFRDAVLDILTSQQELLQKAGAAGASHIASSFSGERFLNDESLFI